MLKHQQKKLPRQGAVKKIGEREICNLDSAEGRRIYSGLTMGMACRQQHRCAICGKFMNRATFDHEAGRCAGKRDDRILNDEGEWQNAAVHEICNGLKGSKRYKWVNGVYKPVEKFKEKAA